MNDRARALAILREARDLVADRLAERILEAADAILDDARGESYMGEIDSLYEQVGMRMVHLSQMISHLPVDGDSSIDPAQPAPSAQASGSLSKPAADEAFVVDAIPALLGPVYVSAPALPAPGVHGEKGYAHDPAITFQTFVAQVFADELEVAGRSLAVLFGMGEGHGRRCAAHFAHRVRQDPQFLRRALQLRDELHADSEQGALAALHQCFGLVGLDALTVLKNLRQRRAN